MTSTIQLTYILTTDIIPISSYTQYKRNCREKWLSIDYCNVGEGYHAHKYPCPRVECGIADKLLPNVVTHPYVFKFLLSVKRWTLIAVQSHLVHRRNNVVHSLVSIKLITCQLPVKGHGTFRGLTAEKWLGKFIIRCKIGDHRWIALSYIFVKVPPALSHSLVGL